MGVPDEPIRDAERRDMRYEAEPRNERRRGWLLVGLLVVACIVSFALLGVRTGGLFLNSAYLALGTCTVCLPSAFVLATLLVKVQLPWRNVTWAVLLSGLFLPLFVITAAWQSALGLQGWYTSMFADLSADPPLSGWRGAIFIHAVSGLPMATLLIGVGLRNANRQLEEDALLYTSATSVLLRVTWRHAAAALVVAAVWIALTCFGEMAVTDVFQIRTFAEEIYVRLQGALWLPVEEDTHASLRWTAYIAALAIVAFLATAGVAGCVRMARRHANAHPRRRWKMQWSTPTRYAVASVMLACVITLMGLPIGSLFYHAGIEVTSIDGRYVAGWSLAKALRMVVESPWLHRRELTQSSLLAIAAATTATFIAVALSVLAIGRRGVAMGVAALAATIWSIPGPVWGVWMINVLNQPPDSPLAGLSALYDEATFGTAIWLAQSIRSLPLAIVAMLPFFAATPRAVLETATLDGAGPLRRVVDLLLPMHWRSVAAAWLLACIASISELAATILVAPPGITPISVRIFNLVHYGVDDQLAALTLFVWLSVVAATAMMVLLLRHIRRQGLTPVQSSSPLSPTAGERCRG